MLALVFLLFAAAFAGPMLGAGKGPGKSKRPFDVKDIVAGNYTIRAWKGLEATEGIPLTGQLTLGEGEENTTASGALERVRVTEVPAADGSNSTEQLREVLESTPIRVLLRNATSVRVERGGELFFDLDFEVDEAKGRYVASGKTARGESFIFSIHSGLSFTLAVRDAQAGVVLYEISKARQVQPQSMKSRIVSSLMMMVPMLLSQWMMRKQMTNMNQPQAQQPAPEGTDVPVGRRQESSESTEAGAANGAAPADTAAEERE